MLLRHGADPDVVILSDHLYEFLDEPDRSAMKSSLLSNTDLGCVIDGFADTSSTFDSEDSFDPDEDEATSLPTSHLVVSATAAFEIPSRDAQYINELEREMVETVFPIIKAKLIAASEEKARRKRMENERAAVRSYLNFRNLQRYLPH